ncbi:sugar kinase [Streptomyces sp. P9(2023)]|uniref:sugar kinase n=1 Tax=Streptomyces sp. P9(2023) TaxID=3064394 RepID=UPI0037DDB473
MVTFLPSRPGRLSDVPAFARAIGGAESNVACALAAAGHRAKWVSRVGADGFGDHLIEAIGAYGVDVSAVGRDAERPTGIYFRTATDRATAAHEVAYYRAGSAASAMSPVTVAWSAVGDGRVLHVSGITAALSDDCLALMRSVTAPRSCRPLVSFDVNFRAGLWRDAGVGGRVLLELARGADLVFVGEDEAEEAWGVVGARAIRAALPEPGVLVVKRGAAGAVVFERCAGSSPTPPLPQPGALPPDPRASSSPYAQGRGGTPGGAVFAPWGDTVTTVPAPTVDVVAAVGAGDAFAAGFLGATLRGLGAKARLRHGHLAAAAALTVPGDLAAPPARVHADRLVALDDAAWERLHLGPGWTGQDQEVRTP